MTVRSAFFVIVLTGSMILQYIDMVRFFPARIKGRVVDAQTGMPVERAHVFVVSGEEEDFTGKEGEFVLKTSLGFPLKISVERGGYIGKTVVCNAELDRVEIILQQSK